MKILLAFNSFKGSLSATEVTSTIAQAIRQSHPDAEIVPLPLADGGDGTCDVLSHYYEAPTHTCSAHDALMRPISANYAICNNATTAIISLSDVIGLASLCEDERDPMLTTSYGLGEVMQDAMRQGCKHIILGIGGSATNDCGMGLLTALGWQFLDTAGHQLSPIGANLNHIAKVVTSPQALNIDITVICDVTNPLFGPQGAAYIYAPQKGASKSDVVTLDRGLQHFASLFAINPHVAGCGAAGGIGYAMLLLGATLRRGAEVIIQAAHLEQHLSDATLVITGEGKIDSQTLCGKLPFEVLQLSLRHHVPCIALAGLVEDRDALVAAGFADIIAITPPSMPLDLAMQPSVARDNLRNAIGNYPIVTK